MLTSTLPIRLGDRARFPLSTRELGNPDAAIYNRSFEAIAFTSAGCVIVRRLHDGFTTTVSGRIFREHALQCRRAQDIDPRALAIRDRLQAEYQAGKRPRGYLGPIDSQPGDYFVSVRRDDQEWRPLAGPYSSHLEALCNVDRARFEAEQIDPRAVWYHFGTIRLACNSGIVGILNKLSPPARG